LIDPDSPAHMTTAAEFDSLFRTHSATQVDKFLTMLAASDRERLLSENGSAALFAACARDNPQLVQCLLKHGVSANATVADGESALSHASRLGSHAAASVLLSAGASDRDTALFCAVRERHAQIVRSLLESGVTPGARHLLSAITSGDKGVTTMLLDHGAEVTCVRRGVSPLLLAMSLRNVALARLLLRRCEPSEFSRVLGAGPSALELGIHFLPRDDIAFMLRRGAELRVNAPQTAAQIAASRNDSLIQLLIEENNDLIDAGTPSPLELAADHDNNVPASILLAYGATPVLSTRLSRAMHRVMHNEAAVEKMRLEFFKARAVPICIGLQDLALPAWCTIIILEMWSPIGVLTPLFWRWKIVTAIKHFKR
jgi:hypothetical protein